MRAIRLQNYPSQTFTIRKDGHEFRMTWMWNTVTGYWSLSIYVDDERCPRMAGKKVLPNVNLLDGYNFLRENQELWVVVNTDDPYDNWYDRLRFRPAGAAIIMTTPEERKAVFARIDAEEAPC